MTREFLCFSFSTVFDQIDNKHKKLDHSKHAKYAQKQLQQRGQIQNDTFNRCKKSFHKTFPSNSHLYLPASIPKQNLLRNDSLINKYFCLACFKINFQNLVIVIIRNIQSIVKLKYSCRFTKFPNYIGYEIKRSYILSFHIQYFYFMSNQESAI